jgi:hypothetical protein
MKKTILILTAAIAIVAALGLTAFSYASAHGLGTATSGFQHEGLGPGPGGDHPLSPYIDSAMADILGMSLEDFQAARADGTRLTALIEDAGLSVEEFQAALQEVLPDVLSQAVSDEVITQTQADAILERGLHPFAGHGHHFGPLGTYVKEASAEILGLTVDELEAARMDGVTMAALLEDAGLTADEFQAALQETLPDIVAAALEDGVITQVQADAIIENGLGSMNCGGGFGRHGGRGGFGPGFGPDTQQTPQLQDAPAVNG